MTSLIKELESVENSNQMRIKQRVADCGEVFTSEREVYAMLDLRSPDLVNANIENIAAIFPILFKKLREIVEFSTPHKPNLQAKVKKTFLPTHRLTITS